MIRVNLLPYRAARAKENIRRQVSVFLLLLVLTILSLAYSIFLYNGKVTDLENKVSSVKHQITHYKEKADEAAKLKKALKILEQKLEVIDNLELMRKEPITLLESMTRLVVSQRMWITYLQTAKNTVTIKGIAFDEKTVADFMKNLEGSAVFDAVDLKNVQLQSIKQNIKVKVFEVLCRKASKKKKKEEPGKK